VHRTLSACAGLLVLACCVSLGLAADQGDKKVPGVLHFSMKSLDGKDVDLAKYQGKVVLVVNVASRCGYTPQYEALEKLHEKYGKDGLVVLGVPANEFGKQEPGTNEQIADFCRSTYNVQFPMLAKVVVKGEGQCPLYKYLTDEKTDPKFAGPIKWNFTKFLISRDGQIVNRFEPAVKPDSPEVTKAIEAELANK
jgi:glutathione peroxidase